MSPLILRLARRAQLHSLELPDTVFGNATINGVKRVFAAQVGGSADVIAPFANLQKLCVCVAPAAVRGLVALVPRITDLGLEFSRAPAAAMFSNAQAGRQERVTVTAADMLPLAQLQNLQRLGLFAGMDSVRGRRGSRWNDWQVGVQQLSEDNFTPLTAALAPHLQLFEADLGYLLPRALAIMAALRFRVLECVNFVGKYDLNDSIVDCPTDVSFPHLRQLRLSELTLGERYGNAGRLSLTVPLSLHDVAPFLLIRYCCA